MIFYYIFNKLWLTNPLENNSLEVVNKSVYLRTDKVDYWTSLVELGIIIYYLTTSSFHRDMVNLLRYLLCCTEFDLSSTRPAGVRLCMCALCLTLNQFTEKTHSSDHNLATSGERRGTFQRFCDKFTMYTQWEKKLLLFYTTVYDYETCR